MQESNNSKEVMLFTYDINTENGINIVRFEGELIERSQANELLTKVTAGLDAGEQKYILDLMNLRYMNSSGLNVLINLLTRIRNHGGDVVICNVNKKIRELLVITKLSTMFNVMDTSEQAMKHLA